MKQPIGYPVLYAVLLALTPFLAVSAEKPTAKPTAPLSREDAVLVTITASVESVDVTKREVTLKGPLGNIVTLTVDNAVKRLEKVKVGDLVRADYYISIAAELRKATPEEEKTPIVALEGMAKSPPGSMPAAGGLRRFKVVTTVEGIDRPTQTVTVKGPMGNYFTARAADPSRLTELRIGDTIVVVLTEALAISLEPVERRLIK